jgi:2-amino-4-hydroxy-6-hydroxymethyldihydropteridine diphosphokinase
MNERGLEGRAWLALGSNLGERIDHLHHAAEFFAAAGTPFVAASGVYETAPVGGPEQGPYLNAIAQVQWRDDPHRLLELAQAAEVNAGRVRSVRWGPRTLDVDLIAIGGVVVNAPDRVSPDGLGLQLPHPRAHERAFVLVPLAELAPTLELAPHGTIAQLVAALSPSDLAGVRRTELQLLP